MPYRHRLSPSQTVSIAQLETDGKDLHDDRKQAEQEFHELRERLIELQYRLYAEGRRKLLVVLQAMDAGGKDGTIRHVFKGVNPQGVRVTAFKAPTPAELAHDFLWRVHQATPAAGMIGVFNRSHYEDVLVVRVEQLVPESVWQTRYERINQFERLLVESGTTILKFFLHISKSEQKSRFEQRLKEPGKRWKFSIEDLNKRKDWNAYMTAYEDVLNRCTTEYAPWHVIPCDQKWYRNLAITRTLVATLDEMDLQYPPEPPGLDDLKVE